MDRKADRQTMRQTDRQVGSQAERQAGKHTSRQAGRQAGTCTCRRRHMGQKLQREKVVR